MFKTFKTLEEVFQKTRLVSVVAIGVMGGLCGLCVWIAYAAVERANSRIYVLSGEWAGPAVAKDGQANQEIECRGHVRRFHELFFDLDPDNKQIDASMRRALYLGDGSVKRVFDDMKESGYLAGMVAGNVSQSIQIDSILVDARKEPYPFRCIARERLVRSSTITTRTLVTRGSLRKVQRSDANEHGLLIEGFEVVENKDLKTETRIR